MTFFNKYFLFTIVVLLSPILIIYSLDSKLYDTFDASQQNVLQSWIISHILILQNTLEKNAICLPTRLKQNLDAIRQKENLSLSQLYDIYNQLLDQLIVGQLPFFSTPENSLPDQNRNCTDYLFNPIQDAIDTLTISTALNLCDRVTLITPKEIGTTGFVISAPGQYCLTNDIIWAPTQSPSSTITINANNVTLNLNGKTINQVNTLSSQAIVIMPGRSNIIVRNGTLNRMMLNGITLAGTAATPIRNVTLEDLHIKFTGAVITPPSVTSGIAITSSNDTIIKNSVVAYSHATDRTTGLVFTQVNNILVKDCVVTGLTSAGICLGYQPNFTNDCTFSGCIATRLRGVWGITPNANGTTNGWFGGSLENMVVENCQASHLRGACSDCHGFTFTIGNGITLRDNIASDILADAGQDGTVEMASGYSLVSSNNMIVENCIANNIRAVNPLRKSSGGFIAPFSRNLVYKNCKAQRISCVNGRAVGFGMMPQFTTSNGTVWDGCIAQENIATPNATDGIGFDLYDQVGAVLINCISARNSGHGIRCIGPETNDLVGGTVYCNTPPNPVNRPNNAAQNLIQNNQLMNNGISGATDEAIRKNVWINNYAYNPGATNFVGLPAGTPIRTWSIGLPPTPLNNNGVASEKLDNISITT